MREAIKRKKKNSRKKQLAKRKTSKMLIESFRRIKALLGSVLKYSSV
jgi:16S rRNA C1402 (ribose-2'-O) methylase RsmI